MRFDATLAKVVLIASIGSLLAVVFGFIPKG